MDQQLDGEDEEDAQSATKSGRQRDTVAISSSRSSNRNKKSKKDKDDASHLSPRSSSPSLSKASSSSSLTTQTTTTTSTTTTTTPSQTTTTTTNNTTGTDSETTQPAETKKSKSKAIRKTKKAKSRSPNDKAIDPGSELLSSILREKSLKYDYVLKIALVGDSGTGKSAVVKRFVTDTFEDSKDYTIGVDIELKTLQTADGKSVQLQIYDTAGQQRFHSVASNYYKFAEGIMVVYDVTNKETMERVGHWIREATSSIEGDVIIFVIGNKTDLRSEDQELFDKDSLGEALSGKPLGARPNNVWMADVGVDDVLLVSAKNGVGVQNAFKQLVERLVQQREQKAKQRDKPRSSSSTCVLL